MNANGGDQDDDMTFVVCDSDTIIINGRDLLTSNGSSNYILDLELVIQWKQRCLFVEKSISENEMQRHTNVHFRTILIGSIHHYYEMILNIWVNVI